MFAIGNSLPLRKFVQHSDVVRNLYVYGQYLFSVSYDRTAIQWLISDGSIIYTYTRHTYAIWTLSVQDNMLMTGISLTVHYVHHLCC